MTEQKTKRLEIKMICAHVCVCVHSDDGAARERVCRLYLEKSCIDKLRKHSDRNEQNNVINALMA